MSDQIPDPTEYTQPPVNLIITTYELSFWARNYSVTKVNMYQEAFSKLYDITVSNTLRTLPIIYDRTQIEVFICKEL